MLLLTESTIPLSVRALLGALKARARRDRLTLYRDELIYLDVKRHYRGVTSPTDMSKRLMEQEHIEKTAQQVIADILKKLGA